MPVRIKNTMPSSTTSNGNLFVGSNGIGLQVDNSSQQEDNKVFYSKTLLEDNTTNDSLCSILKSASNLRNDSGITTHNSSLNNFNLDDEDITQIKFSDGD